MFQIKDLMRFLVFQFQGLSLPFQNKKRIPHRGPMPAVLYAPGSEGAPSIRRRRIQDISPL